MSMTAGTLSCLGPHGFHRLAYTEWAGPPGARTVLCVHGLTRNGRDFDDLARSLSRHFRVVCPDVVGRGKSAWLSHAEDYGYPLYLADMAALIAPLVFPRGHCVGSSAGCPLCIHAAGQARRPILRPGMYDIHPPVTRVRLHGFCTRCT